MTPLPPKAATKLAIETHDYASWDQGSLIKRVTELEAQLRALNDTHGKIDGSATAQFKQKPRKAPKLFDPSRYNTRHIALKFAYLGTNYNGLEWHAKNNTPLPTIEEILWRALMKTKLIFPNPGNHKGDIVWDGVDYSKCGRTDKGVSAFGQVIGLKVRSNRPKAKRKDDTNMTESEDGKINDVEASLEEGQSDWHDIRDEIPYIQTLNRVLPADIRVLAWCPHPPEGFSARFNCKERRYRYFFTNPAFPPVPGQQPGKGDGWLDIEAMQQAAKKYEGLHDFRNFCKVDAAKQIYDFHRRIFSAGIHEVDPASASGSFVGKMSNRSRSLVSSSSPSKTDYMTTPRVFWFEVRGSAFLWHQVRHLVAILFLIGQGYEQPSLVDDLLNVAKTPSKPHYEMADDSPLVLWDCIFPSPEKVGEDDHQPADPTSVGYEDEIEWVYVGDEIGGRDNAKRHVNGFEDGRFGRNGIIEDIWAVWRKRKMDELLAGSLMDAVACLDSSSLQEVDVAHAPSDRASVISGYGSESARIFDGSFAPRPVGPYVPILQRRRLETVEVINARWLAQKGTGKKSQQNGKNSGQEIDDNMDIDE